MDEIKWGVLIMTTRNNQSAIQCKNSIKINLNIALASHSVRTIEDKLWGWCRRRHLYSFHAMQRTSPVHISLFRGDTVLREYSFIKSNVAKNLKRTNDEAGVLGSYEKRYVIVLSRQRCNTKLLYVIRHSSICDGDADNACLSMSVR